MVYKPGFLRSRSEELISARNYAIGLFVALIGIGQAVSEFERISRLLPNPIHFGYLAVFVATLILDYLWIWSSNKEMSILFDWLDPKRYVPPATIKETSQILLLAGILTALIFCARDPWWFGVVFTVYAALMLPFSSARNREVAEAIAGSKLRISEDTAELSCKDAAGLYLDGVRVVELYYLRRPIIARHVVVLVASLFSLIPAFLWKAGRGAIFGMIAYGMYLLVIVISESVLAYWRYVRDSQLRNIQRELTDFQRATEEKQSRTQPKSAVAARRSTRKRR